MNGAITFIITFIMTQLVFQCLRMRFKIKELKQENERIKRNSEIWENMYQNEINILQNRITTLYKMRLDRGAVSKDVIDSVHYAMKKSHPDNGGNAEDFMRFKKVYEEVSRQ